MSHESFDNPLPDPRQQTLKFYAAELLPMVDQVLLLIDGAKCAFLGLSMDEPMSPRATPDDCAEMLVLARNLDKSKAAIQHALGLDKKAENEPKEGDDDNAGVTEE